MKDTKEKVLSEGKVSMSSTLELIQKLGWNLINSETTWRFMDASETEGKRNNKEKTELEEK